MCESPYRAAGFPISITLMNYLTIQLIAVNDIVPF